MSHEKAILDGVRTRLGVRKSREMTLRIHRLENNEYLERQIQSSDFRYHKSYQGPETQAV